MTHIHFIGGEKGGVGKSVVSRLLAQYCIDHQLPVIGFDTDKSHGSLLRFYGAYASPVVIDDYESLDNIVQAATEQPYRRVIVDLAAQTHGLLARWIDDSGLLELCEELGLKLSYWHVMDAGRDSVDLLRRLLDQFGSRLDLVLVLNEIRGDGFEILAESGLRERAIAAGATVLRLPRLADVTMQKIDAHSSSFWAAVNAPQTVGNGLGLLERQRVKLWLGKAFQQLGQVTI